MLAEQLFYFLAVDCFDHHARDFVLHDVTGTDDSVTVAVLMFTARGVATAPAANTIEVFIDDKPVQVDPNCTVLQVILLSFVHRMQNIWTMIYCSRKTFSTKGHMNAKFIAGGPRQIQSCLSC